MQETVIFKDNSTRIAVTNKRFIVDKTVYPIKQIAYVEVQTLKGPSDYVDVANAPTIRRIQKLLLVIFLFFLTIGLVNWWFLLLAAAVMMGYLLYSTTNPLKEEYTTTNHQLFIGISSGKTSAFSSQDQELITRIADALNQAIINN